MKRIETGNLYPPLVNISKGEYRFPLFVLSLVMERIKKRNL